MQHLSNLYQQFKIFGHPSILTAIFAKGRNLSDFPFACKDDVKLGLFFNKRICSPITTSADYLNLSSVFHFVGITEKRGPYGPEFLTCIKKVESRRRETYQYESQMLVLVSKLWAIGSGRQDF